ncbi:hypothetical protein WJU16_08225 [Chitinophaga pollutisoli]|uniref:DUF2892 domain-containing protein n=1 Tax=Chitinophaga pollutisoli TaxID=3133966 RepID=A0ABZ2YTH5_9BACT
MKNLFQLKNWTIMRFVRLAVGLAAVIYAIVDQQLLLGVAGVMLMLMGIFNAGCCSGASCPVRGRSRCR